MDDMPEQFKLLLQEMFTGAFDLVPEERRPDLAPFYEWSKNNMFFAEKIPEWNGYGLAPSFSADTAEHAYHKFVHKEGDILVASYPKTGTTWLTNVVQHIVYLRNPELLKKTKRIDKFYSYLSFGPSSKFQVVDSLQLPRRMLGTHLPVPLLNFEKMQKSNTKILYIIRNPKDQAVSWYNFVTKFHLTKTEGWSDIFPQDERKFYDAYLAGKQKLFAKDGEGYLEHIKEWLSRRNDPNVMFLVYEEMKKNVQREIRKIAAFIGIELSDAEVSKVADDTSFASMKQEVDSDKTKEYSEAPNYVRKGEVGDWKNHLTVAQSELIDANVERILGDTDIKFTYEL